MKNSPFFKLSILVILSIACQNLMAQPQFIIEDKVVFVTSSIIEDKVVFANQAKQMESASINKVVNAKSSANGQGQGGIIEDTIVFSQSEGRSGGNHTLKLDSIHFRLLALKKGSFENANVFAWYNAHPTNSTQIEGYNVIIFAPNTKKVVAECRFARQKTNVWVDTKYKNPANAADIKSVVYSEQNRKAAVETYGGYKFNLSINAKTGKIDVSNKALSTDIQALQTGNVRIYKTAKLF